MQLSVDISLYPLSADFVPPILDFIASLERAPGLTVVRNTLSTQVFGPAAQLLPLIHEAMQASWAEHGRGVFVIKYVCGDARELASPNA